MARKGKLKRYADWRLDESMREYHFYNRRFKRMILTMFNWENLPDGINPRFLEKKLYEQGQVVFFKNSMGFFQVAQCTPMGYNAYEEPTKYRVYDPTGRSEIVNAADCVPIWNDYFKEGNAANVQFFAKRLSNIEKTIDVNLEQLKTPTIVACPEGQLETVKAVWSRRVNGEPFIPVEDDFNAINNFQVWDLKAQSHLRELEEIKNVIISEGLTFFGIDNVNIQKKERLVTGEVDQNNEQIALNRYAMLKARQDAVKQINEKFGLNIKVTLTAQKEMPQEEEGDEING